MSRMATRPHTGVSSPAPERDLGPEYRPAAEKPTATVSKAVPFENVHVLAQTPQLIALLTYVPPPPLLRAFSSMFCLSLVPDTPDLPAV